MNDRIKGYIKGWRTEEIKRLRDINYDAYLKYARKARAMLEIVDAMDDELEKRNGNLSQDSNPVQASS